MPGAVRRLGAYLGLVEDGSVDEVVDDTPVRDVRAVRHDSRLPERSSVRTIRTDDPLDRPIKSEAAPVEAANRIVTIVPQSFNDCQRIGEAFRSGNSVVIDFTQLDAGLRRRVIDFAAGLVFGVHGRMQRVTDTVYMLSPHNVDLEIDTVRQATTGVIFNHS